MNRARALAAFLALGAAAPSWAAVECNSGPLTAEEPQAGAQLGCSAFVRGSALFLGGHRDDSEGPDTGAVTPFQRRSAGPWIRESDLTASDARADTGEGAQFGFAVSSEGDWLAVGAPFADSAQGVDTGAVYLFQRVEGRWVERQKLAPAGAGRGQRFGQVVSMSGDTLLAGAPDDDEAGSLSGWSPFSRGRGGPGACGRRSPARTRLPSTTSVFPSRSTAAPRSWELPSTTAGRPRQLRGRLCLRAVRAGVAAERPADGGRWGGGGPARLLGLHPGGRAGGGRAGRRRGFRLYL